jgi:hypothetical protein
MGSSNPSLPSLCLPIVCLELFNVSWHPPLGWHFAIGIPTQQWWLDVAPPLGWCCCPLTLWSPYPAVSWVSSPVVPTPWLGECHCHWHSNPQWAGILSSCGSLPLCWAGMVVITIPIQWWCGYHPSPSARLLLVPIPSNGLGIIFGWILAPPLGSCHHRHPYTSPCLASSSLAFNPLGWVSSMGRF